ncbi:MAG: tetratricopeptide repeat protein, partial [Chloroflexi bacterium]|nr:tetratricopeptide repeat protein [Chloroflexota bacterium]
APLAADAPGRRRSLRAVFDYFWNFLMEDERRALRKLVVFGGSFQREAARNVAGALPFFLSALVDRAFLSKTPAGRYTMHELLRQYAEEKLREAAPERAQARRRHGAYYLALAEQAEPELKGSQQAAWLERLEQEHDNFRAALDWAVTEGPAEAALRLSGALGPFWDVRGHWTEGRRWLRLALAEPDGLGLRTARAKALNAAGRLAFVQGDDLAAQTLFEAGLTLGRELSDPRSTVTSLTGLGGVASYQGRYPAARSLLAESLALWRALGDKPGIANALYSLGYVVLNLGDYSLANSLLREGLTLQRELGDKSGIAGVLNNLGEVARFQGDYELAEGGIAWLLHNLGYVTHASSRDEAGRALALFKEALFLSRELGNKQGIAACLAGMAGVVGGVGKPERAARLFGAAEALLEASGAVLDSVDRIAYERNVAAVRRRSSARGEGDAYLDEASFTAAWAEGRTMTLEAAMAYALENDT